MKKNKRYKLLKTAKYILFGSSRAFTHGQISWKLDIAACNKCNCNKMTSFVFYSHEHEEGGLFSPPVYDVPSNKAFLDIVLSL